MNILSIDRAKLSGAMQQYYDFKLTHQDCIIFFQIGDFYEVFFDDALEVSKLLEITLTSKFAGLPDKVPMAGVPISSINEYTKRLMFFNKKVAIVSQDDQMVQSGK